MKYSLQTTDKTLNNFYIKSHANGGMALLIVTCETDLLS